jgi:hypothetical protein
MSAATTTLLGGLAGTSLAAALALVGLDRRGDCQRGRAGS